MTRTIQLLRGTTAQNVAFTGASGEVTVDTQTHELRVHDGSTVGGHIIYTKSDVDTALSSKADVATTADTDLSNLTSTGKANVSAQGTYDSGETYSVGTVGEAIQNKANVALDNITNTGINFVAHASMPDYSAGITLSNISSYQQITDDGYIWWNGTGSGSWNDIGIVFSLNGSTDNTFINIPNVYGVAMMVPVSKGIYVKSSGTTSQIIFIPCKKGA